MTLIENKFNPFTPKSQLDLEGGKRVPADTKIPLTFQNEESLITDIEHKLDLQPGELTTDDSTDPNYRPATTRQDKWKRFNETGEV